MENFWEKMKSVHVDFGRFSDFLPSARHGPEGSASQEGSAIPNIDEEDVLTQTIVPDEEDDSLLDHPPLHSGNLAFHDPFIIISGVPSFVFNSSDKPTHRKTRSRSANSRIAPPSRQLPIIPSRSLTMGSGADFPIPVTHADSVELDALLDMEDRDRKTNFKSAATATTAVAYLSRKRPSTDDVSEADTSKGSTSSGKELSRGRPPLSASSRFKSCVGRLAHSPLDLLGGGDNRVPASAALEKDFFTREEMPSPLICCTISDNGRAMATGHGNGDVKIWDVEHGRLVEVLDLQHDCAVTAVRFKDSGRKWLVSCDVSGAVVVWDVSPDVKSREEVVRTDLGVPSSPELVLYSPAISADGRYVALCGLDVGSDLYGRLDAIKGEESMPSVVSHTSAVLGIWNIHEKEESGCVELVHADGESSESSLQVRSMQFSDDAASMAASLHVTGNNTYGMRTTWKSVVVWPSIKEPNVSMVLEGSMYTWSRESGMIATWDPQAKDDNIRGAAFVWETVPVVEDKRQNQSNFAKHITNLLQQSLPLPGNAGFGRRKHRNAVGCEVTRLQDGKEGVVTWCAFVNNTDRGLLGACVCGESLRVVIWNSAEKTLISSLATGLDPSHGLHTRLSVSYDGKWMSAYCSLENKGVVWDVRYGVRFMAVFFPPDIQEDLSQHCKLAFAKNGSVMAAVGGQKVTVMKIGMLDPRVRVGTPYLFKSQEGPGQMRDCTLSYNGAKVGVAVYMADTQTSRLAIWDMRAKRQWRVPPPNWILHHDVMCFSLSKDGTKVVTSGRDRLLLVWVLENAQGGFDGDHVSSTVNAERLVTKSQSIACSFSEDASGQELIVACSANGTVSWWANGSLVEEQGTGHNTVHAKFSADGARLAMLSSDMRTVTLWDLVNRKKLSTSEFVFDLRQLNKPSVYGSSSPMPLYFDGQCALGGLSRKARTPIVVSPASTLNDIKGKVGAIPGATDISVDGEWVVVANLDKVQGTGGLIADDLHSVWVMRTDGQGTPRRLKGLRQAVRSVAMSGDGRVIAAVGVGSALCVWTPHGMDGCIPDYYRLSNDPDYTMDVVNLDDEVLLAGRLLNRFGPAMLNYPDYSGMSVLLHTITEKRQVWLVAFLKWATENDYYVTLHPQLLLAKGQFVDYQNGLEWALQQRSPETTKLILEAMLEGRVSDAEKTLIFHATLLKVAKVFPSIFYDVISDPNLPHDLGEFRAPERCFASQKFLVGSSNNIRAPAGALDELWMQMKLQNLTSKGMVKVPANAKVVPYPDIAGLGSKGLLRNLLMHDAPLRSYGTLPVRAVVAYKWEMYARRLLLEEVFLYFLILVLFTAYAILRGYGTRADGETQRLSTAAAVLLLTAVMLGIYRMYRTALQMWSYLTDPIQGRLAGLLYFLNSATLGLDMASSLLLVFVIPVVHFWNEWKTEEGAFDSEKLATVIAVLSIMLWTRMLYYTLPFKKTGPMVIMLREVVVDITFFLGLAFSILFGFGVAFFILFGARNSGPESIVDSFRTLDRSLVTTFGMIFGEFNINDLYKTTHPIVGIALFVLFMLTIAIVLLNLLIAVMEDTFDRVMHTRGIQFLKSKAAVIDSVDSVLIGHRRKRIESMIQRYIHILVPQYRKGDHDTSEWTGRIHQLEKRFKVILGEESDILSSKIHELKADQNSMDERVKDNHRELKSDIQRLIEIEQRLLERLEKGDPGGK